ncbi:hypothetical protein [Kineosporia babensis]|nr:hypothetical protein [Kineosporia babensis]
MEQVLMGTGLDFTDPREHLCQAVQESRPAAPFAVTLRSRPGTT